MPEIPHAPQTGLEGLPPTVVDMNAMSARMYEPQKATRCAPDSHTSLATPEPSHTPDQGRPVSIVRYELAHSQFGGGIEVMEARSEDPLATAAPPIYYANGTGLRHVAATVQESARQSNTTAFAWLPTGDRLGDSRFIIGNSKVGNINTLRYVSKQGLLAYGVRTLGPIVAVHQMREAATMLRVVATRRAGSRVRAVLQSKAAGHGILAAHAHPEVFQDGIVLAFPANLNGPQTGFLLGRMIREGLAQRRYRPDGHNSFRDKIGSREFARSARSQISASDFWQDAAALRYSSLSLLLHSLRQQEDAPPATLVAGLYDKLYPIEGYLRHMVTSTDFDRIVVVDGSHTISGRKDVVTTILEQFPEMERLRAARSEGSAPTFVPLRDRIFLPPDTPPRHRQRILRLADDVDRRTFAH